MLKVSSKYLRNNISELMSQSFYQGKRYKITRNGKDVAVMISVDEYKKFKEMQKQNGESK